MKLAIVALLVIHGLIHVIGFASSWGLADFQEASRAPTNLIAAQSGDPIVRVLGVVWLLALTAFLIAAMLLVGDSTMWRPVALGAAVISMVPIILWWQNAPLRAVANALVLIAALAAPRLSGVVA